MIIKYSSIRYKSVEAFVRDKLKPIVDAQIQQLQLISGDICNIPSDANLQAVIGRLEEIKATNYGVLSVRDLRILSFHIVALPAPLRDYFLDKYLVKNWKPQILNGLMHSLLLCWNSLFAERIRKLLQSHENEMSSLQVSAFRYMKFPSGCNMLADYLYNHRISIIDSPPLVLLQDNMFHYSFFEDVMIAYFNKRTVDMGVLMLLEEALERHNVERFNKILIPIIVLKAYNNKVSEEIRKELIAVAIQLIGNPNDLTYWQDDTLNEEQRRNLLQARHILRTWMIARLIDKVFTKAASTSYPDRARFWKKYAEHLLTQNDDSRPFLKVLSTSTLSTILVGEERRFYRRLYQGSDNTALLMRFGDYTLVELLEGGCMYVYKNMHNQDYRNYYNYVWSTSVSQVEDLKDPTVKVFLQSDIYNHLNTLPDNGRIAHRGNWEEYFKRFLLLRGIIV